MSCPKNADNRAQNASPGDYPNRPSHTSYDNAYRPFDNRGVNGSADMLGICSHPDKHHDKDAWCCRQFDRIAEPFKIKGGRIDVVWCFAPEGVKRHKSTTGVAVDFRRDSKAQGEVISPVLL